MELLTFVLEVNMIHLDDRTWLQKRQFMGSLNRCPADFYDNGMSSSFICYEQDYEEFYIRQT